MADTYIDSPSGVKGTYPVGVADTGDTQQGEPIFAVKVASSGTADAFFFVDGGNGKKVAVGLQLVSTNPDIYAIMVS